MSGIPCKVGRGVFVACAFAMLFAATVAQGDVIYVANDVDWVTRISPGGGTGGSINSSAFLSAPTGVAFDAAGNLYVSNQAGTHGNTIARFTPSGAGSVFTSNGLADPQALAFDRSGNLYVANFGGTIEKYSPSGVGSVFASTSSGLNTARGLAFDAAGNLFVSDELNDTIFKFTPGGVGSVFARGGVLHYPFGLAFDASGNLFVANASSATIAKFTPEGVGSVFASSGLNAPTGLAFDSAGNLYAVNNALDDVARFTPAGILSGGAGTRNLPQFLAFTDDAGVPLLLPPGGAAAPLPPALPGAAVTAIACLAGRATFRARRRRRAVG